jgi:Ca2+-binding RTX toxin-like protein
MSGGDGNDTLDGGAGKDHLSGGAGDDELSGGDAQDKLEGGDGNDWLDGGGGHDHLAGNGGDDWLQGGDGNDKLLGGDGNDKLKGEDGNDHLDGGSGSNLLDGDAGKNKLTGGDEFDFDAPPPPPPAPDFQPLLAALSGSIVSGSAEYERQTTEMGDETFLQIYVFGAGPGLDLLVTCGSCELGHVLTDGDGFGELRLSSFAGPEGGFGFPDGFAPLAGDMLVLSSSVDGNVAVVAVGVFANN